MIKSEENLKIKKKNNQFNFLWKYYKKVYCKPTAKSATASTTYWRLLCPSFLHPQPPSKKSGQN
jgi:hypothetical protein